MPPLIFKKQDGCGAGWNRPVADDEFEQDIPFSQCALFFQDPLRYQYVSGSFGERAAWYAEQTATAIKQAVANKNAQILAYSNALQAKDFVYQGHTYVADERSFLGTKVRGSRLALTDPVPTPPPVTGSWKTREGLVPMTVAEFEAMADYFYDLVAVIWGKEEMHYAAVSNMVALGATAAQIKAYDHTANW